MRLLVFLSMSVLLVPAYGQDKTVSSYPAMAPIEQYLVADRRVEIDLARSAAPPSISGDAEVLVLGQRGYEVAAKGQNGFVCFVERSWAAGFGEGQFWNPKVRAPNCFNPAAARSVLPQYLERTKWVLAGLSKSQVIEKARAAFSGKRFKTPEANSFSFMLSKDGYVSDDAGGPWLPHVMFFVPHGQAAAWGAGLEGSPVFGADNGSFEPTVLYIPVRRWSDGSPGPAPAEHRHP